MAVGNLASSPFIVYGVGNSAPESVPYKHVRRIWLALRQSSKLSLDVIQGVMLADGAIACGRQVNVDPNAESTAYDTFILTRTVQTMAQFVSLPRSRCRSQSLSSTRIFLVVVAADRQ